jgi:biopolymer transport protein ExbD
MKPISTMNVIPFIDIMLVLLAIILTTATFVAQGKIPISLPQAAQADQPATESSIEITITRDGQLFVDERPVLLNDLADALAPLPGHTAVALRVDEQAAFQHFVGVIDRLKSHRLDNVSIITQRNAR